MKILLAPAEIKVEGGDQPPLCRDNFSFKEIYENRIEVINNYEEFIKKSTQEELSKWFGIKKTDDVDIQSYLNRIEKNQSIIIDLLKQLKSN